MSSASDDWYIRLPDGRVLHAGSTAAVRHHLESGQLPPDCRVRRSGLEPWHVLEKVEEFADLAIPGFGRRRRESSGTNSGTHPTKNNLQLQAVGLRTLVPDLLSALDAALARGKIRVAVAAGLGVGLVLLAAAVLRPLTEPAWAGAVWFAAGLALLVVLGAAVAVLGRQTFLELSHLRPARWTEVAHRLPVHVTRVTTAYVLVMGAGLLGVALLRGLPAWLLAQQEPGWVADNRPLLAGAATVAGLVVEVGLWLVLVLALPLGPILVVEECSVRRGLGHWRKLLREHLARLFLYETLAAAVAVLMAVPFVVPVEVAALAAPASDLVATAAEATLGLLRGLALSPLIGYLAVANVFIYLNLRYQHTPAR